MLQHVSFFLISPYLLLKKTSLRYWCSNNLNVLLLRLILTVTNLEEFS